MTAIDVTCLVDEAPDLAGLNQLFSDAWLGGEPPRYDPRVLGQSLTFVCAYAADRLVGFVNVAWDGGAHAFLLDTTVHPQWRRRQIGVRMVQLAASTARNAGCRWLHVDFEPDLAAFYGACGFQPTEAGLLDLRDGAG